MPFEFRFDTCRFLLQLIYIHKMVTAEIRKYI